MPSQEIFSPSSSKGRSKNFDKPSLFDRRRCRNHPVERRDLRRRIREEQWIDVESAVVQQFRWAFYRRLDKKQTPSRRSQAKERAWSRVQVSRSLSSVFAHVTRANDTLNRHEGVIAGTLIAYTSSKWLTRSQTHVLRFTNALSSQQAGDIESNSRDNRPSKCRQGVDSHP